MFCKNLSGQKLNILPYDTVEMLLVILSGVDSILSRMVPAQ